jgi:hypothetical protein
MGTLLLLAALALWASLAAIVVGAARLIAAVSYLDAQRSLSREFQHYRASVPVGASQ